MFVTFDNKLFSRGIKIVIRIGYLRIHNWNWNRFTKVKRNLTQKYHRHFINCRILALFHYIKLQSNNLNSYL